MIHSRSEATLVAPVERAEDGDWVVRSPGVGFWSGAPEEQEVVGEGSAVGTLTQLNRVYVLRLGVGVAGRVVACDSRSRIRAVEYAEELFRLHVLSDEAAEDAAADEGTTSLAAGDRAVVAPTDGVYYRRPAPDAPVLVGVGDRIRHAQPIGLIEVMKTFNQIVYEAQDPTVEAEVVEIRATEAAEVRAGDVLIVVRDV